MCQEDTASEEASPPETWRGGEFNLYDYIVGSMQVDITETVEDDADGVVDAVGIRTPGRCVALHRRTTSSGGRDPSDPAIRVAGGSGDPSALSDPRWADPQWNRRLTSSSDPY